MIFKRVLAISTIATVMGLTSVSAQSLRQSEIPAEFPPASFKGKQYVDSRGCVYIRAGIDGLTNWVPRVTRDRKVLCGYQPTLAKSATKAPAVTKPVTTAAAPVVITPAAPAAKPAAAPKPAAATPPKVKPVAKPVQVAKPAAAPKPKPKPRKVAKAPVRKPAPAPRKVVRKQPAAPAPVVVQAAPAKPAASANTRTMRVTTCKGVNGVSRYYTGVSTDRHPVRCGPQTEAVVTVIRRETVTVVRDGKPVNVKRRVVRVQPVAPAPAPAPVLTGKTRIVPRHVWEQQQRDKVHSPIPDGYRAAWNDGRLNEKRAHQTIDGAYAIDLAWTRTVPRKLYVRSTGRVVTDKFPGLIYPYHSYDEMRAAGFDVINPGPGVKLQKPRVIVRKAAPRKKTYVATKKPTNVAPAPQAKRKLKATATKGRYVQVGTFGVEANARNSALRLKRIGLPARLGKLVKGGKTYRIVIAGPFAPNQIGTALKKARSAGFRDAFVR
ncbi:SPOR domain-containing protein [Rhodobacteraceae bacterium D3-12]|nr:SPOR domain-containing protein [Rhodobacteraceae bacterium D3-12]